MKENTAAWRGYWPAAPTPFADDGSVDISLLRAVLRRYRDEGVHGVLVNGTTGEWYAQTIPERRLVAETAVEVLGNSRTTLVVGCGSTRIDETIQLAEHAISVGADGVLATVPPYAHPSEEESYGFFRAVTTAVPAPWMIYNWPRGTAVDHSVDLLDRLADLDHVVAIKDSSGDEIKTLHACERVMDRVQFFGRFIHPIGMAFLTQIGGAGNIDGGGLGARYAVPFYEAVWAGDLETAAKWSHKYLALTDRLVHSDYSARFASPTAQLKAAMRLLGQDAGTVRPPLQPVTDPNTLAALANALTEVAPRPATT